MANPVFHCRVRFNGGTDLKKKFGLEKGGRVQQVVDKAVIDFNSPYVPRRNAQGTTLANSAYSVTKIGSGKIVYPGPYAHYQYVGRVRTDERGRTFVGKDESKPILTDRPLHYDTSKHPKAGAEWFERMKENHIGDILTLAQKAMEKGG